MLMSTTAHTVNADAVDSANANGPTRGRRPEEISPRVKRFRGASRDPNADPLHQILLAMLAFRSGEFSWRLPSEWTGIHGKIADAFNDVLLISERRAKETARVSRMVGKE